LPKKILTTTCSTTNLKIDTREASIQCHFLFFPWNVEFMVVRAGIFLFFSSQNGICLSAAFLLNRLPQELHKTRSCVNTIAYVLFLVSNLKLLFRQGTIRSSFYTSPKSCTLEFPFWNLTSRFLLSRGLGDLRCSGNFRWFLGIFLLILRDYSFFLRLSHRSRVKHLPLVLKDLSTYSLVLLKSVFFKFSTTSL
jgi:hypothetical protein